MTEKIRELLKDLREAAEAKDDVDIWLRDLIKEAADALEHLLQYVEWKDIKDAPENEYVLADNNRLAWLLIGKMRIVTGERVWFYDGRLGQSPTGWLPLPPPPSDK